MTRRRRKAKRQEATHDEVRLVPEPDNAPDATSGKVRCPNCGKLVDSLCCGHCGSQLPDWQADLYGATVRQIAKLGGNRADTSNQGGNENDDRPKGGASTPQWLFDDAPPHEDGQPCGGNQGDGPNIAKSKDNSLQDTETPPSLCRWIFERLADAGIRPNTILDPCAGRGNLTRPFRPESEVIEYEIRTGTDFFEAKSIACDLVLCNPRWSEAERWLRHLVEVVGNRTPIVFISPMLFFSGYKDAPVRKYLESPQAPRLHHCTPLPSDTFVKVYSQGAILWFNLPDLQVGLVPSSYLIRSNTSVEDALPTTTRLKTTHRSERQTNENSSVHLMPKLSDVKL